MTDHFQNVVDYVMGEDASELSKVRAERDYALHCLERELSIAQQAQSQLADATKLIEDLLGLELGSGERAMAFLASVGGPNHE